MKCQTLLGACLTAVLLPLGGLSTAIAQESAAMTSEIMPLAVTRSLLLDIAEGDQRAIMVGERGHILVSESRSDWRQIADVPTRATLTAVAAVGSHAWAVGHDGTILHSADGGLTWSLQRVDVWTKPGEDEWDRDPRVGAPFLDVMFTDANNGIAIGAYSLLLKTSDGGANWKPVRLNAPAGEPAEDEGDSAPVDVNDEDVDWGFSDDDLMLDQETDPHLNGIARTSSGLLFIVAERGSAYRSRDDGQTWERLRLPYDGSMFGVVALGAEHLLAFGLRGNIQESVNGGDTWVAVDSGTTLSLLGGAPLGNGGVIIVGANGVVLKRADGNSPFTLHTYQNKDQETPVLSTVLARGEQTFLVAGEKGFGSYQAN